MIEHAMPTDPSVDAWFDSYDNPMRPAVQRVREIILAADHRVTEAVRWQAPTFVYKGNIASFYPTARGHVSLMFHQGAKIPGDHPILEGEGATSRTAKFADLADVESRRTDLEAVIRAWCAYRDT